MRYLVVTLVLFLLLSTVPSMANSSPDPIKDCPAGLVCLLPEESVKLRLKVIDLKEKLAVAKAKRLKRIGLTMGCGAGVPLAGDTALDGFCGVMWGFRF